MSVTVERRKFQGRGQIDAKGGLFSRGMPVMGSGPVSMLFKGKVIHVDSGHTNASDNNDGENPDRPMATLDAAVAKCSANNGDVILVSEGHAETIAGAAGVNLDLAGITVIGLGQGEARPKFSFSAVASTIVVGAANVRLINLVLEADAANTIMLNVDDNDCVVENCEFREGDSRAVTYIDVNGGAANACDRFALIDSLIYSPTAGSTQGVEIGAVQDRIRLVGNHVEGDFSVAGLHSASINTRMLVADNYISNANAGDFAIELSAAATGLLVNNRLYADAAATCLDPGSLKCVGNEMVNAIDQSSIPVPTTAGGVLPVGAIGATSFAAGAIDAAAIADAAIDAATFAAGAINAAAIANDAIDATAIATNAIDADALAADAVAEIADGVTDEAVSGHVTAGTVGAMLQPLHSGTAQAGAAGTVTLAAAASATNNLYNGCVAQLIGGTGVGQVRMITAYNGGTKVATVAPSWATTPDNTSVYVIRPHGPAQIDAITSGAIVAASFTAAAIDAAAIATNAIDADALAADAVAEIADGVTDEAVSGHVTAGTVGAMLQPLHSGTAQAGAAGTITLAAAASAVDDFYNGAVVQIVGGTGVGQLRVVTDYTGATRVANVAPVWGTNPDNTAVYVVLAHGPSRVEAVTAGAIDAGALATDALTNAKIADNAFASEQFAVSAGEKTNDGVVVTRATAALPQTANAAIFTITGLVLLRRLAGYVTTQIGAVANATKLGMVSTGAGADTDLCATVELNAAAVDSRLEITGTFANAMVKTTDVPLALTQAANIVLVPGTLNLYCAGSDGGTGRVRWSATYTPLEAGAQMVAA